MTVSSTRRGAVRVVSVDGDVSSVAALVELRSALSSLAFTEEVPVVVDLTGATGITPAVERLLDRESRVMAHRGVILTVQTTRPAPV